MVVGKGANGAASRVQHLVGRVNCEKFRNIRGGNLEKYKTNTKENNFSIQENV